MRRWGCLALLLALLAVFTFLQTEQMRSRPLVVKLGFTPAAEVLRVTTADQRYLVAEFTVLKVLFYYGSLVNQWNRQVLVPPETFNMYKTLETAVKLDPYNMDAYYFAQSAFTWEVGRVREVNALLDYGMKYRTWDWYLPFFAGFNSAYFLRDYAQAGPYMRKAAELSGSTLFTNLAARYFYEAGRTDFGLAYLDGMIARASDPRVRSVYQRRRDALLGVKELETALALYRERFRRLPHELSELVAAGLLARLPQDPYGGDFYLDPDGRVRSTSKFAERDDSPAAPAPQGR